MDVRVGPSTITIHSDDRVLVCEPDAIMSRGQGQGFSASDTGFVSGYRLKLGDTHPVLLNSSQVRPFSSRFEFSNAALETVAGTIPAQTLHLRLVHEGSPSISMLEQVSQAVHIEGQLLDTVTGIFLHGQSMPSGPFANLRVKRSSRTRPGGTSAQVERHARDDHAGLEE